MLPYNDTKLPKNFDIFAIEHQVSVMKFVSWNVNGLRAVCGKGFADIFSDFDADFVCLQETKLQQGQLDLAFLGYTSYWNYADKKGYSGTAIYTKHTPLSVTYGIGVDEHDHEGRVITLEMPDFFLVNVYVPNSQDGLRRLDYRMKWEDDFLSYIKEHPNYSIMGDVKYLNLDSRDSNICKQMILLKDYLKPCQDCLSIKPVYMKD